LSRGRGRRELPELDQIGRGIITEVALRQPAKRDEIGIVDGKEIEIAVRIMPLAKCPQKIALRK
jgi:hypothetical protein